MINPDEEYLVEIQAVEQQTMCQIELLLTEKAVLSQENDRLKRENHSLEELLQFMMQQQEAHESPVMALDFQDEEETRNQHEDEDARDQHEEEEPQQEVVVLEKKGEMLPNENLTLQP